jgi:hypothetical protein
MNITLKILTSFALLIFPVAYVRADATPSPTFSRPGLKGVVLEDCCVKLLKLQSAKLEAVGATKKLLAWSPLMLLAGETSAPHAAFSIATTNWDDLAKGITAVDALVFTILATEALVHSHSDHGSPTAKVFWKTMSDFYSSRVPGPPPSHAGHWKGTAVSSGKTLPMEILVTKTGGNWGGQINLDGMGDNFRNTQVSGKNVKFTVGQNDSPFTFDGTMSQDGNSLSGSFTSPPANGTFSLKRQPN